MSVVRWVNTCRLHDGGIEKLRRGNIGLVIYVYVIISADILFCAHNSILIYYY